jgi:acetyltransferase-like isoleucine patch superfamily enzyme
MTRRRKLADYALTWLLAKPWPREKRRILRVFGAHLEPGARVAPGLVATTYGPQNQQPGAGSYLGPQCLIDNYSPLVVGKNVQVAARANFATATHDIGMSSKRAGQWSHAGITIGDGTWIGAGVTVLSGVVIGPGCIIAAGSVVTRDCEPDGLYAGVPARRKKDLSSD